jgi:hypothetical protein
MLDSHENIIYEVIYFYMYMSIDARSTIHISDLQSQYILPGSIQLLKGLTMGRESPEQYPGLSLELERRTMALTV